MSKSKNNGVDPQALIEQYGADTARFYTMFASPPTNTLEWSDESVERLVQLPQARVDISRSGSRKPAKSKDVDRKVRYLIHLELKKANDDIQTHQFNTVASACMKILNALEELPEWNATTEEGLSILLRLLSPIAPHITHHLWRELKFGEDIMTGAVARARSGGARAGRGRAGGAGERQAARLDRGAQAGRQGDDREPGAVERQRAALRRRAEA